MAGHMEDDLEEKEFKSLKSFEQQRFLKKIQEMDKRFKDLQTNLKNRAFLDIQEMEDYKQFFNDEIDYWTYEISSWESKYSDKKKLSARIHKELMQNSKQYREMYASLLENFEDKDQNGLKSKENMKYTHDLTEQEK